MRSTRIFMDDKVHADLKKICELLNSNCPNSFVDKLTPAKMLEMLANDMALAYSRPGSWEGANMLQVLSGHGYQL